MPKILVVDDALADRALVTGLVAKWMNSTVFEAVDGRDALSKIEIHQPDVVLTDLHMPVMNGFELVTAIRQDFPFIPVVLMTAQGSEEIAAQALRGGAASYVPKRRLADDLFCTLDQVHSTLLGEQAQAQLMHFMTRTETSFQLHNDLTLIRYAVDQCLNLLRCVPLGDETERLRVGIALEEALENAYFHGNLEVSSVIGYDLSQYSAVAAERLLQLPYRDRRIHLDVLIDRDQAQFTVTDEGPGFDLDAVLKSLDPVSEESHPGRGITLMRSIMDEVRYNSAGNEVTLIKRAQGEDE
ncbi:MAG: response regulator [Planctomycetaceae bacterium]|nr:response regulator [Planctomycetaceae bacterium]